MVDLNLGDEYEVVESNNDLKIRHIPSGDEISYGPTQNEWDIAGPLNAGSVNAEDLNNTLVAAPGEVQSKIDDAANTSHVRRVQLKAGVEYNPTSEWDVKQDITLDCNDAYIVPNSDINVFLIHDGARVVDPYVDVTTVTYTSNVYNIDTARTGENHSTHNVQAVSGGFAQATTGEGTLIYLHQNGSGDGTEQIAKQEIHTAAEGFGTMIDIHSEGGDFINANVIRGFFGSFGSAGIHTRGSSGDLKLNRFEVDMQLDQSNPADWGWYSEYGRKNTLFGHIPDLSQFNNYAWELTSSSGGKNSLMVPEKGDVVNNFQDNSGENDNGIFEFIGIDSRHYINHLPSGETVDWNFEPGELQWRYTQSDGTQTRIFDILNDRLKVRSLLEATGQLKTPNQASVNAYLGSDQPYSTSDGYVTVQYDTEGHDEQAEFDTSTGVFTAANAGKYSVEASVGFGVNTSGDTLAARLVKNVGETDERILDENLEDTGSASTQPIKVSCEGVKLASGDTLEVIATNLDNDDTIQGTEKLSHFRVHRVA